MSWLDSFLIGVSTVATNGVTAIKERGLNLIAGSGVTITASDNPTNGRVDITITSTGGTGAVPTGTGFYAVVGGVMTAAARAVNLASADITGILAAANQAAQAMAGDVGGTTAANTVNSLKGGIIGLPTGGVINWSATASPGPQLSQNTTASATASNMLLSPQASSATNGTPGSVIADLSAPTGTGAEPALVVSRAGTQLLTLQADPAFPTALAGVYLGTFGATPNASNFTILGNQTNTFLNAPSSSGTLQLEVANTTYLTLQTGPSQVALSVPILGNATPWGVHGEAAVALSATRAATSAEYAMGILVVTPTASGFTYTMYNPSVAAFSYPKLIINTSASFTFTLSTGAGTSVLVPVSSKNWYAFDTSGVR